MPAASLNLNLYCVNLPALREIKGHQPGSKLLHFGGCGAVLSSNDDNAVSEIGDLAELSDTCRSGLPEQNPHFDQQAGAVCKRGEAFMFCNERSWKLLIGVGSHVMPLFAHPLISG